MKIFLIILLLSAISCFAQQKTITESDTVIVGWYGAPVVKLSEVNHDRAVFFGARGGVIINHHIGVGIGGYGLFSDIEASELIGGNRYNFNFGYGGVEVEYIHNWNEVVHYTMSVLIGAGSVSYRKSGLTGIAKDNDQFLVAEPTANLQFNFTKYMRIDLGAGYRFVSKIFFGDLSAYELDGFTATLALKFGKF